MNLFDLFKPKWRHSKTHVRMVALDKMTDQKVIEEIARSDKERYVREKAVNKITNQDILYEIALTDTEYKIREAAFNKINDQNIFEDIVRQNNSKCNFRKEAVSKLMNQNILTEIAKTDIDRYVRLAAIKNLTEKNVLEDIAGNDKDRFVRLAAMEIIGMINDSNGLALIKELLHDKDVNKRKTTIETCGKIGDYKAVDPLIDLYKIEKISLIKEKIIETITKIERPASYDRSNKGFQSSSKDGEEFSPVQTKSSQKATNELFQKALPFLATWDFDSVLRQYHGFIGPWGANRLIKGETDRLCNIVLSNLKRTEKESGFLHFIVQVSGSMGVSHGIAQIITWSDSPSGASVCLWRSVDGLYLCGNHYFR